MHISEGVLSAPLLLTGAAGTLLGVAWGLRKMDYRTIPQVAVLSSAFFVASLIQIPLGPMSVHLVLNGLLGIILGPLVFPAIVVALSLQALLFQFGGFTTLGINTLNMALPAILAFIIFRPLVRSGLPQAIMIAGFLAGLTGGLGGVVLIALCLVTTGEVFINIARAGVIAHLPVIVIEGFITMFTLSFIKKVKPEILEVTG